jgi:TIR domain
MRTPPPNRPSRGASRSPSGGRRSSALTMIGVSAARWADDSPDGVDVLATRSTLYDLLYRSCQDSSLDRGTFDAEERGGELAVLISPEISTTLLLGSFIESLRSRLDYLNRTLEWSRRLRLKIVINRGVASQDSRGYHGSAIDHLFLLLGSAALRSALRLTSEALVVGVSNAVHDTVARPRPAGGGYARIPAGGGDLWVRLPSRGAPPRPAATGIFINYRDDAAGWSVALDEELSRHFGRDNVFRASRSVRPSEDFHERILASVCGCAVLVALINPQWFARDSFGKRRIDAATDWVRREIAAALAVGVPVVPILLDGAPNPADEDLPEELAALGRRQYIRLHHRNAQEDLRRIVDELARFIDTRSFGVA